MNNPRRKPAIHLCSIALILLIPFHAIQQCNCCCASEESSGTGRCCSSNNSLANQCCCSGKNTDQSDAIVCQCGSSESNVDAKTHPGSAPQNQLDPNGLVKSSCNQCKCFCSTQKSTEFLPVVPVVWLKPLAIGVFSVAIPPLQFNWDDHTFWCVNVGTVPVKTGNLQQAFLNVWRN